ncbi:MAG TPA: 30S ribosomal protein S4 [Candidatus Sumerlaeota bacterium]|nr:30S ribosomal protein S4 [Candidatus Sumerlaeota bacterium]HRR99755.1 30S ribosomal protein S4 [Candidatus Sumerlaeia bacterium]HON51408.1 30S ribosomal protein S4 [Candidatus Sumerlaeota bacterium]HOR64539.1 30S ribosomal protein S4 [Candidatus Sumerlaeota bacterium]HPL73907.1 30S ribosomal protein S4 [Candidatus Sumerlaeota bacterium]
MARYIGPVCRLCRREGKKLYLKGDRCQTAKCAVERRSYPPGQHGQAGTRKLSTYGVQLREKQRAKRIYGLLERQFRRCFQTADRLRGVTGTILMQLLERRLDNIVYRLGFAPSRRAARQLVRHGHILVNGKKVDIPSYRLSVGEEVSIEEKLRQTKNVLASIEQMDKTGRVPWLEYIPEMFKGKITTIPAREDIPSDIQEQIIIELYSK